MYTAYPYYPARTSQCLDAVWALCWLGDIDAEHVVPAALTYDELAPVPGVFDTSVRHYNARGVAIYTRRVHCATAGAKRLEIGGLGLYGRVFWDGEPVGECTGPYTHYAFDFETGAGMHDLHILVDNRFTDAHPTLFHPFADFYAFGGIYRSVSLCDLPPRRIERVIAATTCVEAGRVRFTVLVDGFEDGDAVFDVAFDHGASERRTITIAAGRGTFECVVPHAKIWHPESPNLHTVTVSAAGDSVVERFGIRTIATRGAEILLNGAPIRLCGVNRHESHPELGPIASPQIMFDDLMHVKHLGANFVRCVHYPQDPLFLDMCDQVGVLVWEESLGWNNPESDAQHPLLHRAAIDDTAAMIRRDINHPCIAFWGFLNETRSDTAGIRELVRDIAAAIRAHDATRLVTFASNQCSRDLCFDLVDVISVNMYPGWIDSRWDTPCHALIRPRIDAFVQWASRDGRENKPLIMSEIGACGIYGTHDYGRVQWTEEFQADFFAEACRAVLGNPRFAGIALWQMFDTRSFINAGDVRVKPFGLNLAGLLDAYRRPKLAYETVRHIFHDALTAPRDMCENR